MLQLLKPYLLLSSLFLFSGCHISKYKHLSCDKIVLSESHISPILKGKTALKYNASIDILNNHLTGLLVVKQTDSISKHIVFVTELGMKMFDFEVKGNEINVVYVFEPLNKPKLINVLKQNFSDMLLLTPYGYNDSKCENQNHIVYISSRDKTKRCFTISKSNELILQETFRKNKRISKINYTYNAASQTFSQIKCKQYGLIKFYFELNEPTP
jgi:hypothetical protein